MEGHKSLFDMPQMSFRLCLVPRYRLFTGVRSGNRFVEGARIAVHDVIGLQGV
jgi:hypothetical protein